MENRLIYRLIFLMATIIAVVAALVLCFPMFSDAQNLKNEDVAINTNTGKAYTNLSEAVMEASAGNTLEIIKENPKGHSDVNFRIATPGLIQNNITIKKSETLQAETCIDCDYPDTVAYFINGANFENLSFYFGRYSYHGIDGTGILNFNKCTLYGLQICYVNTNYTDCTFINEYTDGEYNMWTYTADLHYSNCDFYSYGKFINVYNSGFGSNKNVNLDSCRFHNNGSANKSAVNVKATATADVVKELYFTVNINNCQTIGDFPTSKRLNNKLAMIDDGNSKYVTISIDNGIIYPEKEKSVTDVSDIGDFKELTTSLSDPGFSPTEITWTSSNEAAITLSVANEASNEVTGDSVIATRVGYGFSKVIATDEATGLNSVFYFGNPTLSFNMQGHGQQIDSQSFDPLDITDLPKKPDNPSCEGFEFEGWYTTTECTDEFDFNQLVTEDTTIYAKWKELPPGPGPDPDPDPDPGPEPQNPEFINMPMAQTADFIALEQLLIISIILISFISYTLIDKKTKHKALHKK